MGAFQTVQVSFPTFGLWVICGDKNPHRRSGMFHSFSSSRTVSAFLFRGGNSCPHTITHPQIIDPERFRQVLSSSGSFRKEELGLHLCRDVCLPTLSTVYEHNAAQNRQASGVLYQLIKGQQGRNWRLMSWVNPCLTFPLLT